MPAYVYIVPAGDEFLCRLTVGVQTFTLQYPGTHEEMEWSCNMLHRALERAGARVLLSQPPESNELDVAPAPAPAPAAQPFGYVNRNTREFMQSIESALLSDDAGPWIAVFAAPPQEGQRTDGMKGPDHG